MAAGFILVVTLVGLNAGVSYLTYRHKKLELLVDGKPQILIHNGLVDEGALVREHISHHELMAAIRQAGLAEIQEVRVAILETNGHISVISAQSPR